MLNEPRLRSVAALLGLVIAVGMGCSSGDPYSPPPPPPPPNQPPPPPPPPPPANQVTVGNDFFSPQVLTVATGAQVNFQWATGARSHNVTPVGGNSIPNSGNLPATRDAPFSFIVSFNVAGTFNYYCSTHGAPGAGMHGSVVVQ